MVADTPGQIEIFTWSASGAIVTEAFASTFPTVIAYIVDTPRCVGPQTFMTNMLQVGGWVWVWGRGGVDGYGGVWQGG